MIFDRRPPVPAPADLGRVTLRRDGDPAVRRGRQSAAGHLLDVRGLGEDHREDGQHHRAGAPGDLRSLLLPRARARLPRAHGLGQHLHTSPTEHHIPADPVRARRGPRQGMRATFADAVLYYALL